MGILDQLPDHLLKKESLANRLTLAFLRILVPFGIGALVFISFFFYDISLGEKLLKVLAAYATPFVGPIAAAGAGITLGVNPLIVVSWLTAIEICGAMLVWLNFVYLEKIPKLGEMLHKAEQAGYKYLSNHPWVQRLAIGGIIVFIMIPIQGAGPLTAPILGRIMGLKMWEVLLAVGMAGLLRFGAFAGAFSGLAIFFPL